MGVRVRDTKPDTRMAAAMVTANSWSSRPRMPPMKNTGINTAARDRVMERMVKPISREPVEGRLEGRLPHLHVADDVFQHHDGVVHHEPHRQDQGHQGEVVQAVVQQIHDRESAHDGHGQGQAGDDGGREVAQEEEDHQDHQAQGQQQGELDVVHRFPDGGGAVIKGDDFHRGGNLSPQGGQQLIDGVHHLDGVGPRLALDGQDDRPGYFCTRRRSCRFRRC